MAINKHKTSSILYHYTSVETLLKIIENSNDDKICFRATHAKFFNDPFEYKLAFSLLKTSLTKYENQISSGKKLRPKFQNKSLSSLGQLFGNPHILSLSENSDDLTMWRTYGFDGSGVSIGLDKKMLEEYSNDKNLKNTKLIKCVYDRNKILKGLINYWKYVYPTININEENRLVFSSFSFALNLTDFCFSFKRSEYQSEKEWRLCKNDGEDKNIKFYERNGLLIPYIEHYFPKEIIKKIIVGPCVNKELTKESIEIFLKIKGFSLTEDFIGKSKMPYRNFK